ncbi:hypothetical protein M758_1G197200 [Ceratodon purpureus]|nr:hypothetical protein M758_1G196600 [Ceratodon purpureus]KAG0630691.1 hypothetical protein M758_1G197200 [Ceratodon purpureus]
MRHTNQLESPPAQNRSPVDSQMRQVTSLSPESFVHYHREQLLLSVSLQTDCISKAKLNRSEWGQLRCPCSHGRSSASRNPYKNLRPRLPRMYTTSVPIHSLYLSVTIIKSSPSMLFHDHRSINILNRATRARHGDHTRGA